MDEANTVSKMSSHVRNPIAARFSAAAGTYDRRAHVQQSVSERTLRLIRDVALPPDGPILELGCGTGILPGSICRAYPLNPVCAIDVSPDMVAQAKRALGTNGRVRWAVADAAGFQARESFALIVSSSSMHWMSPLAATLANVARLMADGGHFICALMIDGTLAELHEARQAAAPGKVPRGRLPLATEVDAWLEEAGLGVVTREEETVRAAHESAAEFFDAIHEQGLTSGPVSTSAVPLNRGELRAAMRYYDDRFRRPEGGVFASYRVLYVHARKG